VISAGLAVITATGFAQQKTFAQQTSAIRKLGG